MGPPTAAAPAGARSLAECLSRGGLALRANWQLVPLLALQNVLLTLFVLLSLVPPVLVLAGGGPAVDWADPDPAELARWLEDLGRLAADNLPALALALVASTVLGVLAVIAWAFFQSGVVGVLAAGDRQAPAGSRPWPFFRTFSWRDFVGWGSRYLWRFFGFFHLILLVALLLASLLLGLLLVVGLLAEGAGAGGEAGGVVLAAGCGLLVVFTLIWLVFGLWTLAVHPYLVDLAETPAAPAAPDGRRRRGLRAAAADGWRLLARRPAAMVGILVVAFVLSIVLVLPLVLVQMAVELVLPTGMAVALASLASIVLQSLASSLVTVFGLAAVVALARGEALRGLP